MRKLMLLVVTLALAAAAGCSSEKKQEPAPAAKPIERPRAADRYVTSKDGTRIAFETAGTGPAVIIVSGALSHRGTQRDPSLVARLADRFTVYTYDRRGRGQSTDVKPYAVEREIEDLAALIDHAGGSAQVYGVSSGAALALQAAASLGAARITRLALYEPPYGQDPAAFARQKDGVDERIANGKPGDAAAFFMTAIGTPPDALAGMKRSPDWKAIEQMDFTLAYDFAVLGDGAVPADIAGAVTVPTLVMNGDRSMPFMPPTADQLAHLIPHAERRTLAGQTHQAAGDVVAPILIDFFSPPPPERR